jgi:hypothetical protein
MKKLTTLGFFVFLFLAFACTEKDSVIKYHDRTLVILSDYDEGSDIMLAIQGAVRTAYPDVEIHYFQTKLFDIKEASYLLNEAIQDYPIGTYFAAIVEPGANMNRIVFETGGKRVLCPDNGICSWTIVNNPAEKYYFVDDPKVYVKSSELPVQEFYQYAILSLLSDRALSGFGEICPSPVVYTIQSPVFENDTIKGEVLFTDNFGNCISNLPLSLFADAPSGNKFTVIADTSEFEMTFGISYSSVPVGDNVCFINGTGRLEMAVNYGDLSDKYNIHAGTKVFLYKVSQ